MSTWTHIAGCIRFDGIPSLGGPLSTMHGMKDHLGATCSFDDDEDAWDKCSVPCGSEGSLQYKIIRAGDGMVLWTVAIWGDLRDYDNVEAVQKWFDRITTDSQALIRTAIMHVQVGESEPVIMQWKPKE